MKAIFFDQDNTISNTAEIASKAYEAALFYIADETGVDDELLIHTWKANVSELKNSMDPEERSFENSLTQTLIELTLNTHLVEHALNVFYKKVEISIRLTAGTNEFFKQDLDIFKILWTEASKRLSDIKLNKFDLKKNFDMIITSTDMGVMKPDIKYLEKAWNEFNLKPEECIYIGDNWEKDCKLGQEKGGIGVVFGPSSASGQGDERADYCISNMMELIDIIEKLNK